MCNFREDNNQIVSKCIGFDSSTLSCHHRTFFLLSVLLLDLKSDCSLVYLQKAILICLFYSAITDFFMDLK